MESEPELLNLLLYQILNYPVLVQRLFWYLLYRLLHYPCCQELEPVMVMELVLVLELDRRTRLLYPHYNLWMHIHL